MLIHEPMALVLELFCLTKIPATTEVVAFEPDPFVDGAIGSALVVWRKCDPTALVEWVTLVPPLRKTALGVTSPMTTHSATLR